MRIRTSRPRHEVKAILRSIPGAIKGTGPDIYGLGEHYRSALIYSLLTSVYEAYLLKSLGGTDSLGNSWPELTPETKAYHKPSLRKGIPLPGNKRRPTLTPAQDQIWKHTFITELTRLRKGIKNDTKREPRRAHDRHRLGYPVGEPKGNSIRRTLSFLSRKGRAVMALFSRPVNDYNAFLSSVGVQEAEARHLAAQRAWTVLKDMGATTLLELLGDVNSRILFETGRLQESYNPGTFRIPYTPTNADQSIRVIGSQIHINSIVPYKPSKSSSRPPVPQNIGPWVSKAKRDAAAQLGKRLQEIL